MLSKISRLSVAVFILTISPLFTSAETASDIEYFGRLGLISGSFSGAEEGSFTSFASFEGGGELHKGSDSSVFVRATLSADPTEGKIKYFYGGFGQKYYLWGPGLKTRDISEGDLVEVTPKSRYFVNWDLGLAEVRVRDVTSSLSVQSTIVDFGGGAGYIMQRGSLGIEFYFGATKGISISSVAIDSLILRMMFGVTY